MVKITTLPVDFDKEAVLAEIGKDVSRDTGVAENMITYYWQTFDAIVWNGAKTEKPVFVDLHVASFFSDELVQKVMIAVADALVKHAGADRKWLFIHTHLPLPGQVYIAGGITDWDAYRGKPNNDPRDPAERSMDKFLFNDSAFRFQALWRFGLIASGGGDLGELLTITGKIEDFDHESWYQAWNGMARQVRAAAEEYARDGRRVSARQAWFRATEYFRAASIYLYDRDPRGQAAWQDGRDAFLKAVEYSGGRIEHVRIPYEDTTLPGYFLTPDDDGKQRPLIIVHTGLDGTAEDLFFIIGVQAAKRGYNCLIFEGPGQGEMIGLQKRPFCHDWENVVAPVVDFALTRPEVDPSRLALLGYSMGGYLCPRALAHEDRIRWGIVDGGVFSVFDGSSTKVPAEALQALESGDCETVNQLMSQEMESHPELNQFFSQMLWTFRGSRKEASNAGP